MSESKRFFFPNLNGLRFLAAFAVCIDHIEQYKFFQGLDNCWKSVVGGWADLAVTLFFVLSGFLITYLLLIEKSSFGDVSIKAFYARRVFRIWPVYYLVVFLGMVVLPAFHFFDVKGQTEFIGVDFALKMTLFVLILPNVVGVLFPYVPHIHQTWSIGVEEQFYLVWPWLIKKTTRYVEWLIAIIVVFKLLGMGALNKPIYVMNNIFHFTHNSLYIYRVCDRSTEFFYNLRIGCMAIGALFAYLLFFKKSTILKYFYTPLSWYSSLLILPLTRYFGWVLPNEVDAFIFAVIILNLASNPSKSHLLEFPVLSYLGKISYGIYMYHLIAIAIAFKCVSYFDNTVSGVKSNVAFYFLSIIYVIALASASYYLFELRFLNLKDRFTKLMFK
jgi:peptidoglycan/LPS O-acetylase OafA/YrhL